MKLLRALLDTIAPNQCLVCEQEGSLLCDWCSIDAFETVPSRCAFCQRATPDCAVCDRCRRETPLRQVWVGTVYKDTAKELVRHMKFRPDRSACEVIAHYLDQTLPYFQKDVIISSVPTARVRVRQRGFDHAELIAREFAQMRELRFERLLTRIGSSRQVGSEKKQRRQQIQGAYEANKSVSHNTVILIDDIMTTGVTLNEAARTLKKAGVKQVHAAVFAQTI